MHMQIRPERPYEVRVAGKFFLKGDMHSTGVVFNNLEGKNYLDNPSADAEHQQYLAMMERQFDASLTYGTLIEQVSPSGLVIKIGNVGASIQSNQERHQA